jgi:hypothetical protein
MTDTSTTQVDEESLDEMQEELSDLRRVLQRAEGLGAMTEDLRRQVLQMRSLVVVLVAVVAVLIVALAACGSDDEL